MNLPPAIWVLIAFITGSLPFSVWIGRLALGKDIRQYGDGNPGAINVFRAGGKAWGWLAILLDGFKGAIPVGLAANWAGLDGGWLIITALAPILGHAYSPFLKGRGGKAIAVTFGTWTGISLWIGPIILGLSFAIFRNLLKNDGQTIAVGQVILLIAFLVLQADWTWYAVLAGSSLILLHKHLTDRQPVSPGKA